MTEFDYTDLPVAVRKSAAGDSYEVGFVLHGALFPFGAFKAGGFEDDLAEALEAETKAKADAEAEPPTEAEPPSPAPARRSSKPTK